MPRTDAGAFFGENLFVDIDEMSDCADVFVINFSVVVYAELAALFFIGLIVHILFNRAGSDKSASCP